MMSEEDDDKSENRNIYILPLSIHCEVKLEAETGFFPHRSPHIMHFGFGEGSRLAALAHTIFYLVGAPIVLWDNYGGDSSSSNQSHSPGGAIPTSDTRNDSYCHSTLGCFKIRYADKKGYSLRPNPLEEVSPTICLHTKALIHTCQVVELEGRVASSLEIANGTGFWIAHGYIENGQRPWIQDMVKELLDYESEANVFVLDWSEASKPPYDQAVENVEMIGAYCGDVMVVLQETYGLKINETHFIGHSLGAQLGGYLGAWLKENRNIEIGRISGLDPAQLYFEGLPPDARLEATDAIFVDVLHTDAKPFLKGGPVSGLGTQELSGHADFFPNGGKDQPGCKDGVYQAILQEEGSVINGIRRFLGCDHIRSYEYFTESIRSPCPYMAFACESWEALTQSNCNISDYNKLGFHAKKPMTSERNGSSANSSVRYYSITGPRPPFCREHYKVVIQLAEESKYHSTSELHLVLGSSNGVNGNGASTAVLNLGAIDLTGPNLTRKYTVSGVNNGLPSSITLRPSSSNPLRWLMTNSKAEDPVEPDVILANVTLLHLETLREEVVFCPEGKNFFSATEQNPSIKLSRDKC